MKARRQGERFLRWAASLIVLAHPQVSPRMLPVSALPLDLAGVIVNAAAPSWSVCLIRCTYPPRPAVIFRAGQNVFNYAEIKQICREGIVLLNLVTNRPELLTFAPNRPGTHPSPPPPPPVLVPMPEGAKLEIPKATIDHYVKNLPELLDSAYASPRYRDGAGGRKTVEGFEISRIKEGGIVEQLGLKDGDVILDVNGFPLDSLASFLGALGRVHDLPQAKMTVLRKGRKMTFQIDRK